MKKNLIVLVFSFLLSLCFLATQAQTLTVKGQVRDKDGLTLPGVSVLVKGTMNGTAADIDGNYTLTDVPANSTLVYQYIGMITQEIPVDGKTSIDVTLVEETAALEEVVIIGYGSVKKKDATGAVDAISSDEFTTVNATSPAEMLRGKVSGVQVTQSSGEPGGAIKIRVRGNTSVRSGNEPLIIVDGVSLSGGNVSPKSSDLPGAGTSASKNPLNFINENDIESINILKDAASTAIYGSRGANGVIVITTKKGRAGKAKINLNSSFGISSLKEDLGMMSPEEFVKQATAAGSSTLDFKSRTYDWTDAILQKGASTSHNIDFAFGGKNSSTRVSFGYLNQEGIVQKTGLQKYSTNVANKISLFDGVISMETKLIATHIADQTQAIGEDSGYEGSLISTALYWNPTRQIDTATTNTYTYVGNDYLNPVEFLDKYNGAANLTRILASISPTVDLKKLFNLDLEGNLTYKFLLGLDYSTARRTSELLPTFDLSGTRGTTTGGDVGGGWAGISNLTRFNQTFESTFNYDRNFETFGLKALLGYSYYSYRYKDNYIEGRYFNLNQTNLIHNLEGGKTGEYSASSARNENELQSFFARLEGSFLENTLDVTASVRYDGSTRPGENNKYAVFPSIGAGYKIFDNAEDEILNNLKIRANWGIVGNQEFDTNSALQTSEYSDGNLSAVNNSNKDLKWETTTSYGVGLDFDLLDRTLSGSIDYYKKETKDLIFPVPPASVAPGTATQRFVNMPGILENTGFEVGLNYDAIQEEDLSLSFNANMAFLSNTIKEFPLFIQAGRIHGQGLTGAYAQVLTNNKPIYSYYLYEWRGFDATGNSIYADAAGNGAGLGLAAKNVLDKTALPKTTMGFGVNLGYKDFDFNANLYGAFGHYIYNNTANALFFKGAFLGGRNVPTEYATTNQAKGDPNAPSTKYLEKGDYIKLSNISLGYTFTEVTDWLSSIRLFVTGSNLLTITDYTGFDPEVDTDKTLNGVPSAGIDYITYPSARTVTFGVNVSF